MADSKDNKDKTHLFDDPKNVKRVAYALFAVSAISAFLDFVVDRHEELHFAETYLFHCIYGFVACVILVLVAKELRKVLMRPEDYYDE
jgi:hypothetical protein